MATTLGFSIRHGLHHDAQKSTIVTFPIASFKESFFPAGVLALNAGAVEPGSALLFPGASAGAAGWVGSAVGIGTSLNILPSSFPFSVFFNSGSSVAYSFLASAGD